MAAASIYLRTPRTYALWGDIDIDIMTDRIYTASQLYYDNGQLGFKFKKSVLWAVRLPSSSSESYSTSPFSFADVVFLPAAARCLCCLRQCMPLEDDCSRPVISSSPTPSCDNTIITLSHCEDYCQLLFWGGRQRRPARSELPFCHPLLPHPLPPSSKTLTMLARSIA